MSTAYLFGLAAIVFVALGVRIVSAALPVRRFSAAMSPADLLVLGVGAAGLVYHCGAMFFRSQVEALRAPEVSIVDINGLGAASIAWYVVPALMVLVGLRGQRPATLAVLLLSLGAVGVTMYDGGPVRAHLTAIFALVVVLVGVAAFLVRPVLPVRGQPGSDTADR